MKWQFTYKIVIYIYPVIIHCIFFKEYVKVNFLFNGDVTIDNQEYLL